MSSKIGRIGRLGVLISSIAMSSVLPDLSGNNKVSLAASAISYHMYKGDKIKLSKIIAESKLSRKKKKQVSKLYWNVKNKKNLKLSKKKIYAARPGTTKLIGYTKKKKDKKRKKSIIIHIVVNQRPQITRTTTNGVVKGMRTNKNRAIVWYGIPYGATTAGGNRWKAPQPCSAWAGVRNASVIPQKAATYSSSSPGGYSGTEDCLYVNVYRPYTLTKNLPVLVYLHGGGNSSGTANVDFQEMAASMGVVIVSVSFRLGAFGYISHPALRDGTVEENSGNFTLLDIRQALQWVRREISVFGGNPWNVTLSGFSSGGRDVLMCLMCPSMRGLFQKVFVMSGGYTTCTPEEGQKSVEERLAGLLVKRGTCRTEEEAKTYLKKISNAEIKKLFVGMTTGEVAWLYNNTDLRLDKFPQGFTDGVVLPKNGSDVIRTGSYNRVPVMLGSDATEFSSFAMNGSLTAGKADLSSLSVTRMMELMQKGIQYGSMLQSCFYIEKVAKVVDEDVGHNSIYAFRMLWGTDASVSDGFYSKYIGAYHGQTRDFLLGQYKQRGREYSADAVSAKNEKGRNALTAQMRSYLKNFMIKGNPNGKSLPVWNTWSQTPGAAKVLHFNAAKNKTTTGMKTEQYDVNSIFAAARANTTEQEYTALTESLWKGRFFMP